MAYRAYRKNTISAIKRSHLEQEVIKGSDMRYRNLKDRKIFAAAHCIPRSQLLVKPTRCIIIKRSKVPTEIEKTGKKMFKCATSSRAIAKDAGKFLKKTKTWIMIVWESTQLQKIESGLLQQVFAFSLVRLNRWAERSARLNVLRLNGHPCNVWKTFAEIEKDERNVPRS